MKKRIIALTLFVIVIMCLFPPWSRTEHVRDNRNYHTFNTKPLLSEYAFILSPPESSNDYDDIINATIDISRLAVQCVIVLIIGGGLTFLWPKDWNDWDTVLRHLFSTLGRISAAVLLVRPLLLSLGITLLAIYGFETVIMPRLDALRGKTKTVIATAEPNEVDIFAGIGDNKLAASPADKPKDLWDVMSEQEPKAKQNTSPGVLGQIWLSAKADPKKVLLYLSVFFLVAYCCSAILKKKKIAHSTN